MTDILNALWGDRDAKKAWKAMEARAHRLPRDFRSTYGDLKSYLWKFTGDDGRDIVAVLGRILALFENSAAAGKEATDVTGGDLAAFADKYVLEAHPAYQTSWRNKLNRGTAKRRG